MKEVGNLKRSKTEHIPQTDSITEMAEFGDSHDITDFDDELEEVKEPIFDRWKRNVKSSKPSINRAGLTG